MDQPLNLGHPHPPAYVDSNNIGRSSREEVVERMERAEQDPEAKIMMMIEESKKRSKERANRRLEINVDNNDDIHEFDDSDDDEDSSMSTKVVKWFRAISLKDRLDLLTNTFVKMFAKDREGEPSDEFRTAIRLLIRTALKIALYSVQWVRLPGSHPLQHSTAVVPESAEILCDHIEDMLIAMAKLEDNNALEQAVMETARMGFMILDQENCGFDESVLEFMGFLNRHIRSRRWRNAGGDDAGDEDDGSDDDDSASNNDTIPPTTNLLEQVD